MFHNYISTIIIVIFSDFSNNLVVLNLNMKNCVFIIMLTLSIVLLITCISNNRRSGSIRVLHKLGTEIAADNLIQKYEKEHQKFYEEETKNGDHYQWPALSNKNLSIYCRKYLQHFIPRRAIYNANGEEIRRTLHYEKENINIVRDVVIVHCKVIKTQHTLSYYMTRAPEPNCVYALNCIRNRSQYIYTIIQKYCDFDGKPLIKRCSKQKRNVEVIGMIHVRTGQPIAKEEYLLEYELKHQEMFQKRSNEGKSIEWSKAMLHPNLDFYCYQYMAECFPRRTRKDIRGCWKTEKLHYQKLNTKKDVDVTVVACTSPFTSSRCYYMTKAPEKNCVYALLRLGRHCNDPLIIIFKHCDFENLNDKQTNSQYYEIVEKNEILKTEAKEESFDALETLQLFQKD